VEASVNLTTLELISEHVDYSATLPHYFRGCMRQEQKVVLCEVLPSLAAAHLLQLHKAAPIDLFYDHGIIGLEYGRFFSTFGRNFPLTRRQPRPHLPPNEVM